MGIDTILISKNNNICRRKTWVGTTSLAVNTAFLLAEKGNKVVFVELNDTNPSVSYWYELGLRRGYRYFRKLFSSKRI